MKLRRPEAALVLGSEIIERLIPHRRPFLLVDQIRAFVSAPKPGLRALKHISANEPVFAGHFPDLHLWPGVYTIEGMGQTCNLLFVLCEVQRLWEEEGHDPDEALDALRNLQLGYRLHPGFSPEKSAQFADMLRGKGPWMGFSAAVNIKLTTPVFAGQTITYEAHLAHVVGDMARFEVEATVDKRPVARGTMTSGRGYAPLPGA